MSILFRVYQNFKSHQITKTPLTTKEFASNSEKNQLLKILRNSMKQRCFGNKPGQEFYAQYHDEEWGIAKHDDRYLFEMIILEGAQAGLSWETILKRRNGYRKAFHNFDVIKVANMSDDELDALCNDSSIIRNRLKIYSARQNAQIFLLIQKEFGSFDHYLWNFVNHTQIINQWQKITDAPVTSKESNALSKDLKKRGMKFVGSTIMYAYMQAVGLINDHSFQCWRYDHENINL